jgi:hypothetical protein
MEGAEIQSMTPLSCKGDEVSPEGSGGRTRWWQHFRLAQAGSRVQNSTCNFAGLTARKAKLLQTEGLTWEDNGGMSWATKSTTAFPILSISS